MMENDFSSMNQNNQREPETSEINALKLKNEILSPHIPFINQMIANFTGTEFEENWQTMLKCVQSNKKRMTVDQIYKLDSTLTKRKADAERIKKDNDLNVKLESVKFDAMQKMPKPADLGQPVLSSIDLQALIEELSGPSSIQEPPIKIAQVEREAKPAIKKLKINILPKQPMVRLPSSYVSSKITPPRKLKNETDINSILNSAGISSPTLSTFRIPKKSSSPNSISTSSSFEKNDFGTPRLQSIDLFKGIEDMNGQSRYKLLHPEKRDAMPTESKQVERESIAKIKIVRSPASEKKNFFTIQKSVVDPSTVTVKEPEELLAEMESSLEDKVTQTLTTNEKEEKVQQKLADREKEEKVLKELKDEELKLQNEQQEQKSKSKNKSQTSRQLRMAKELSRLHEDIVKKDQPLSKRRSCTKKRSFNTLQESPVTRSSAIIGQDKPAVKRARRDEKVPETSIASSTKRKSASKTPEIKSAIKKVPDELPKVAPTRTLRNSTQAAKVKETMENEVEHEISSKDIELKPCSIDLSAVQLKMKDQTTVTLHQTARKSTSKDNVSIKTRFKMMMENRPQNWKSVRQTRSTVISHNDTEEDEEWEDIDEPTEDDEGTPKQSDDEAVESEPEDIPQIESFVYKTVCNIAFTHCKDGPIYKCMVDGCRLQTLLKIKFIKHLEIRHKHSKWNGYCNGCLKTVEANKGGLTIITEFIHMLEEHLLKEKAQLKDIPTVTLPPEHDTDSSGKSSNPDMDSEMIKGIDLILNELLPPETKQPEKLKDASESNVSDKPTKAVNPQIMTLQIPLTEMISLPKVNLKPAAVPMAAPVETKVISKNIFGRVIPNSQVSKILSNVKLTKFKVGQNQNQSQNKKPEQLTISKEKPSMPVTAAAITKPVPQIAVKPLNELQSKEVSSDLDQIISFFVCKDTSSSTEKAVDTSPVCSEVAEVAHKPNMLESKSEQDKPSDVNRTTQFKSQLKPNMFYQISPSLKITDNLVITQMAPRKIQPLQFLDKLRPWLGIGTAKDMNSYASLTTAKALSANFKCLGNNCSFYTIDAQTFMIHLSLHSKYTSSDRGNYLSCSYCTFIGNTIDSLIGHICTIHVHDKYQCQYCFYRSCVPLNVVNHQHNFHKMRSKNVLVLENKEKKDYNMELDLVKISRSNFISPLTCPICNERFFIFKVFLTHFKEHPTSWTSTCMKCGNGATKGTIQKHMTGCYGLGLYQCVYCRYGTNTFEAMSNHLSISHPTRLPFLCERSESTEAKNPEPGQVKSPSTIESTCLKHINQKINATIFKRAPQLDPKDFALVKNLNNVGNLGNSLQVHRNVAGVWYKAKESSHFEQLPTLPNGTRVKIQPAQAATKPQLQIKEVYSLANNENNGFLNPHEK